MSQRARCLPTTSAIAPATASAWVSGTCAVPEHQAPWARGVGAVGTQAGHRDAPGAEFCGDGVVVDVVRQAQHHVQPGLDAGQVDPRQVHQRGSASESPDQGRPPRRVGARGPGEVPGQRAGFDEVGQRESGDPAAVLAAAAQRFVHPLEQRGRRESQARRIEGDRIFDAVPR